MRRGKNIYNKVAAGPMDGQFSLTRSLGEGGGKEYINFSLTHILKNKIYCLMAKAFANQLI